MKTHLARVSRVAGVLAALALASPAAHAESLLDKDAPRKLFDAGAQAYSSGQFAAAIQAFDQAQKLAPRAQILFSLAQAQRRQYFVDKNPDHLRAALKNFRAYLKEVPEGGRRVDAAQARGERELLETRIEGAQGRGGKEPARLMVLTRAPGAMVSFDGGPPKPVPHAAEVAPGPHRVHVTAEGFYPETRDALAVDNAIVPFDVPLREKPATLTLVGPHGADVFLDGQRIGAVGSAPLSVPAGRHVVTVQSNGHWPFSEEVDLRRGAEHRLETPLPATRQRWASYGLLGLSASSAVVAGVFGYLALDHESEAKSLDKRRQTEGISSADRDQYDREIRLRDRMADGSSVSLGVAAGAGVLGAVLWIFDPPSSRPREGRARDAAPGADASPSVELGLAPGPGGVSLRGAF